MSGHGQPIFFDAPLKPDASQGGGDTCAYYFWIVLIFVFLVSLFNTVVLLLICSAYNITPYGINLVEYVPESDILKFLGDVTVDEVLLRDGVITSFQVLQDIPIKT